MKIFISWSGERSRQVGELINHWIAKYIQAATPWISGQDIASGAMWFDEIKRELDETSLGIICLTRENLYKPWILFEAGALAKGTRENRVCTFLIDLPTAEVHLPLSQFNATTVEKESFRKLARTINASTGKPLADQLIDEIVDDSWPSLQDKIKHILDTTDATPAPAKATTEQLLQEILTQVLLQSKAVAELRISTNSVRRDVPTATDLITKLKLVNTPNSAKSLAAYFSEQEKAGKPLTEEEITEKIQDFDALLNAILPPRAK